MSHLCNHTANFYQLDFSLREYAAGFKTPMFLTDDKIRPIFETHMENLNESDEDILSIAFAWLYTRALYVLLSHRYGYFF